MSSSLGLVEEKKEEKNKKKQSYAVSYIIINIYTHTRAELVGLSFVTSS